MTLTPETASLISSEAHYAACAELVDLGVEMMLAQRQRLHPDQDPWPYVRDRICRQAEESHRANLDLFGAT